MTLFTVTKTDSVAVSSGPLMWVRQVTFKTDAILINDFKMFKTTKPKTEGVRVFDSLVRKRIFKILTPAAVRITDSTKKTASKVLRDALRIVDSTARTTSKTLRDMLRIRDSVVRTATYARAFADPISIRERVTETLAHLFKVAVTDMVRITDSIIKQVAKTITDMVRIRDVAVLSRIKTLLLTDMIRVQDFATKKTSKILVDILRIVDRASASFVGGHLFTVTLSDAVRIITAPIGLIHQVVTAVAEAAKSIGHALENALHPGSKRKGSLGEADS